MRLMAIVLVGLAVSTSSALAESQPLEPLPSHYGMAIYELASFRCKPARPSCPPACHEPSPIEPLPKADVRPDQPPVVEPTFAPEQAAAFSTGYAAAAPNMIGDLVGPGFAISFPYTTRAVYDSIPSTPIPGDAVVELGTFAALSNAKVAENNSALPTNRVYFRYNYFDDTNQLVGLEQGPLNQLGAPTFLPVTRNFSTNFFTFGIEKTFLRDLASVEVRVPFYCTLDSNLALANGVLDAAGDPVFNPAGTLGNYGTEFGDLSLILKALLYYRPRLAVAAGLGVTVPTGPDANVQVVDLYSSLAEDDEIFESQRTRTFQVKNESCALSPYLAALWQPTDRLFFQGFYQFYFPAGGNSFTYREDLIDDNDGNLPGFRTAEGKIDGQSFMLVDVGAGYWFQRNAGQQRLTGLAGLVELHYTTALENADIVTLPGDGLHQGTDSGFNLISPQPPPQIGNLRNRMDILNLTVGSVAEFGNRLLVTTGFGFPLRSEDRVFDWEFQLQINYRFGPAPAYFPPPM